jgi:hypothetical protein
MTSCSHRVFTCIAAVLICGVCSFAEPPAIKATWAQTDISLDTNPALPFWRGAATVFMENDAYGHSVPRYRTEVRVRWTKQNLYFLFACPYEQLNLKPNPNTSTETYELWNWDVAEVFIGSDFNQIKHYKEFEVSPQGEWVDLNIDLNNPHHEEGWTWNSGFQVSARIDRVAHVWYGTMKIPYAAVDSRPPAAGNLLRINLFRSQGPASGRHEVTWQAPMSNTFHMPERFGLLELAKPN